MRIVFVSWEYPPQFGGGIGTYVYGAATTLAARGHEVTVITVSDDGLPSRARLDGVRVVRLPVRGRSGDGLAATISGWQARADSVAQYLHRMIRAGMVDLIEFADYRGEGLTFLTETRPDQRPVSVVRLHTALYVLYKYNSSATRYPVLEHFEGQAILSADRVGSPSEVLAHEMRAALPGLRPVEVTPYPTDLRFLDYDTTAVTPRDEVLYVGRFEQRKGVETLMRAADAFLAACPDLTLTLIGGDTAKGPKEPSMRAVVERLVPAAFADRVRLCDPIPREQLIERYAAARFCVFPSLFENFPNTCLESMSLGKCVIGTDNSGMAEMIQDGINGLIARAGDADDLAEKMIRLGRMSEAERTEMGQAARQRMIDRYHPDVIGAEMEALYERYIREHGFAPAPRVVVGEDVAPPVAVVVPCFNHGRFLPETIASVQAQTYPHVRCIVVDDGSDDPETHAALRKLAKAGQHVIHQDNQGLSAARNTGVQASDTPFYVPLDADDKLHPEFVEVLLRPLLADESLGYSYSHVEFFDAADGVWECPGYEPGRLLVENLSVATALVRRTSYDLAGGYQTDMVHGFEDWDLWLAMLSVGFHGRCTPRPLFYYRKHADGSMLSATQRHRSEMVYRIIEHHRLLFMAAMEPTLVRKDEMFFRAHMDAWHARSGAHSRHDVVQQLTRERDAAWEEAQRVGRGWERQRDYIKRLEAELERLGGAVAGSCEDRRPAILSTRWPLRPILERLRSSGKRPEAK